MRRTWIALAVVGSLAATQVHAHGIWGHVHVTGWAVENMPNDELRSFLLDDPEVFNELLFGAVFTDTGYSRNLPESRAYSEHTHWEPFIEDFIEWMAVNDPPPWTTLESKKRVAFLLGAASHGMQDSIFDSLFLHQVEERDGAGQGETDPGTDGFLWLDDHIRFIPTEYVPYETVVELYTAVSIDITQQVIEDSVGVVTSAYINDVLGPAVGETLGNVYEDTMPWGREHYMDPAVPGSLRSEIWPTMAYQQAIWARLHGEFPTDNPVIYAYPTAPHRLRSGDSTTVDSWVTLIFGVGVGYEADLAELVDHSGQVAPFSQANTRWGAGQTRLIRMQPTQDLVAGDWYTAQMRSGVNLINGTTTSGSYRLPFQVACESGGDPRCLGWGAPAVARIDGLLDVDSTEYGDPDLPITCHAGARPASLGWWSVLGTAMIALGFRRRR